MSTFERDASITPAGGDEVRAAVEAMARDLGLAAATDVPVLISGDPTASLELACELYQRSGASAAAVVLIDCRHHAAAARLGPAIADSLGHAGETRTKVLLLLEVHALGKDGQEQLEERLEAALLHRRTTAFRVIASSSASLFDCVAEGRFRERLYYFLNMIHIVVPPRDREA